MKIKTILHATDFSEVAFNALEYAVFLATRFDARLRVLHSINLYNYSPALIADGSIAFENFYDDMETELQEQLSDMTEKFANKRAGIEKNFRRGTSASYTILDEAENIGADLIVMGNRGHSEAHRFFIGSVAEQVVRHANCPVLLVSKKPEPLRQVTNILLPIDFSDSAQAAAQVAVDIAKTEGATLHLAHVWEAPSPPPAYPFIESFPSVPEPAEKRDDALDMFMSTYPIAGIPVKKHLLDGRVSKALVNLAKRESIDLVVMGTAGLDGIKHFLIGSVTEKVLRRADIPVLTVKTKQE